MPRRRAEPADRSVDLLEQLVLLQLHVLGASQGRMARFLGKSKVWVNACLKGVPKPKREV